MNGKEYTELAQVTEPKDCGAIKSRIDDSMVRALHSALGLSSELAELKEAVSISEKDGMTDYVNLQEEAGDLAWYTAIAIAALELDPDVIWPMSWSMTGSTNTLCSPISTISKIVDGLVVSVGEFNNQLKRALFYGKKPDKMVLAGLVQNIAIGIMNLSFAAGSDLNVVQDRNIAKLKARYGEKFSEHAALNRDLKNEREVLEGK